MNESALRAEIARNHLSIPALANTMGIGKKALYAKMKGESEFKQSEIKKLKSVLSLSDDQIIQIFFAD